ncbi:hypothetical protein [Quatrionicoccus australiensis]|uniref:hypothetical protein n=1 Tax=Quatrionicoccus australiensis TaxID=138118 RepID=UPI001CF89B00|nr:hypothetical protein [Quatrionicoccus australiensis]UCV13333.1 hypothetical protein KI612_10105 [Quatrionicoccus australiensis]
MNNTASALAVTRIDEETFLLLGLALYCAQKFEFGLYGIASHMSHLPEAKKDKRFANLTPDDFLSADPEKKALRKATLGQICTLFGERLLLSGEELEQLVTDRNIVVHDFWREVHPMRGVVGIQNPNKFLRGFITNAERLNAAIKGLLSHMMEAVAQKEGRSGEVAVTDTDLESRKIFESIVAARLTNHSTRPAQNAAQCG